jgi:hypothetical protein
LEAPEQVQVLVVVEMEFLPLSQVRLLLELAVEVEALTQLPVVVLV